MLRNTKRFTFTLLHIDDNADDRLLLRTALYSTTTLFDFHGMADLQTAMDYFGFFPGVNPAQEHPDPDLVLLDYDLGPQRGSDFLHWIRIQHSDTALPVIMYSSAGDEARIAECYALGANHFLRKAQSFQRAMAIARALRVCFSFPAPPFQLLTALPESEPDPRMTTPVVS